MELIKSTLTYILKTNPGPQFGYYIEFAVLIAILIIASITLSQIYQKRKKTDFAYKRLFKKTSSRFLLFGILFTILVAFRYENIPYFSMRIWLYLSILLFLYFLYKTIKTYKKEYPKEKQNAENMAGHSKEANKYLPNKNKKK